MVLSYLERERNSLKNSQYPGEVMAEVVLNRLETPLFLLSSCLRRCLPPLWRGRAYQAGVKVL
jgi:hypothetical protein